MRPSNSDGGVVGKVLMFSSVAMNSRFQRRKMEMMMMMARVVMTFNFQLSTFNSQLSRKS
jgi:hypothetical protein